MRPLVVAAENLSVCRGPGEGSREDSGRWALDALKVQSALAQEAIAARDFVRAVIRLVLLREAVDRLRLRGSAGTDQTLELDERDGEVRRGCASFAADADAVAAFAQGLRSLLAGHLARWGRRPGPRFYASLPFLGAFTDHGLDAAFGAGAGPVKAAADKAVEEALGMARQSLAELAAQEAGPRPPAPVVDAPSGGMFLYLTPGMAAAGLAAWWALSAFPSVQGALLAFFLGLLAFLTAALVGMVPTAVLTALALVLWGAAKAFGAGPVCMAAAAAALLCFLGSRR
ncbi:MAG: hypothetical protein HYV15_01200 [Elusimicrobia bacterium]|nr:hypothetical protein [Elusimicrobiota bacterium]